MFDPSAPGFSHAGAVEKEIRRVSDICHTCRRCYNLCPSFDVLFRTLDRPEVDGEADRLTGADLSEFSDLCYECKLCIPHCPYYPPHRWEVDIPRLVFRDRAARVKREGKPKLRAAGQSREDQISAVHYVRFRLGEEGRHALERGEKAELSVDHADYRARAILSPQTVAELIADLSPDS